MKRDYNKLTLKYLRIDTYNEPVVYMRKDCHICLSEGFEAQARVQVTLNNRDLIATLNTIDSDILHHNEASLSHYAWNFLSAKEKDVISIAHPRPLESLSYIRSKIYDNDLSYEQINEIIKNVVTKRLSDTNIAIGDDSVGVSIPHIESHQNRAPVIIDDIISTGETMIYTIRHLNALKLRKRVCIAIHGIFSKGAYNNLLKSNVKDIVTCNTVFHETNQIDVSSEFINFLKLTHIPTCKINI